MDKHGFYMSICDMVSKAATCNRGSVGAVIVKNDCICSTGYNGAARGLPDCKEVGCHIINGHCCRTMHAEENAIIQAARIGVSIYGATMYCTYRPCQMCTQRIINAGIIKIIYQKEYTGEYFYDINQYKELEIYQYIEGKLQKILSYK